MSIPIFDSLAHPTLTGKWLGHQQSATFTDLLAQMQQANIVKACAIGMDQTEGYAHTAFMEACSQYPELIPVAGLNPNHPELEKEIETIKQLGYVGVKVHARFSGAQATDDSIGTVFQLAAQHKLVVFYCTYMHTAIEHYPVQDPLYALIANLKQAPTAKVILVHGGDVQLLRYAELVRFNHNLLLDLSLTLFKYEGSSIDADIRFLFQRFDRRICIGTDHPEYSAQALRKRFEIFAEGIPEEKKHNIAHKNLATFLASA